MRAAIPLLALALASTCGEPERPRERAPERSSVAGPIADHMKDHFSRVALLRDAVIAGNLEGTREPAQWLARHPAPDEVPQEWVLFVTDMRVVAGAAADARDLSEVADALTVMARTCARCHVATRAKVPPTPPLAAPPVDDVAAVMLRHKLAADRMWEGQYAPLDEAWREGAAAMAEATLLPRHVTDRTTHNDVLRALEARVQRIANEARTESDALKRGGLYGELLTTCAHCHRFVNVL
jgi:cytochrome c556